ncbi:MAG: prenyltransferase/squalene oxidase repeat-containing protein [Planctomycetota bacterium]|nr:prenyltransferase/squalene oxidase repeat-containing protein [Planctomycetota bacterium]
MKLLGEIRRSWALFVLAWLLLVGWAAPLSGQQESSEPQDDARAERPAILERPMDFSQAPKIVKPPNGPSPSEIERSIDRGVKFLMVTQNKDGSFGTHETNRLTEVYAPIPGAHDAFRAATTALSVSAILEAKGRDPEVQPSIDAARSWMLANFRKVKRATGDAIYNVWSHAYGLQALVRLREYSSDSPEMVKEIDDLMRHQVDMLRRYETIDGGWGYYDFNAQGRKPTGSSVSFVNATVLIALYEASQVGIEIPEKMVTRAVAAIKRQQKPDFSYLYGEYLKNTPMRGINRPGGSLGRSQACNLALRLWGDPQITDNVLKAWLYRLYLRNGWLGIGRKRPIPHESWMQVAGYFYYYGHYYAGLCIDQLQPEDRTAYQQMLSEILSKYQEPNGCWWDYTLYSYHQQYGTAFAIMAMQRCLPTEKPAESEERK